MNIIKKTLAHGQLAYYMYDGWCVFSKEPLDLSNVVRFTSGERELNKLGPNEEWQSFGCYKEL